MKRIMILGSLRKDFCYDLTIFYEICYNENQPITERGATLSLEAKPQGREQHPLTVQIYYLTFLCDKQEFSCGFSLNYP